MSRLRSNPCHVANFAGHRCEFHRVGSGTSHRNGGIQARIFAWKAISLTIVARFESFQLVLFIVGT
ncbi:MAG: hypothetical protein WDO73_32980 [Ignavibacteriota bacterium]